MKTNLKLAFVTAASFWALAFWPSHEAHAQDPRSAVEIQKFMMCRDCPFPMKIADGVWIMPNEKLEVHIEKIRLPSRFEEVHVTLRDPDTHEILARGMSKQKRGRKTATRRRSSSLRIFAPSTSMRMPSSSSWACCSSIE